MWIRRQPLAFLDWPDIRIQAEGSGCHWCAQCLLLLHIWGSGESRGNSGWGATDCVGGNDKQFWPNTLSAFKRASPKKTNFIWVAQLQVVIFKKFPKWKLTKLIDQILRNDTIKSKAGLCLLISFFCSIIVGVFYVLDLLRETMQKSWTYLQLLLIGSLTFSALQTKKTLW